MDIGNKKFITLKNTCNSQAIHRREAINKLTKLL